MREPPARTAGAPDSHLFLPTRTPTASSRSYIWCKLSGFHYWQIHCMTALRLIATGSSGDGKERNHMSVKKTPGGQMNRDRYAELKRILEERRREILSAGAGEDPRRARGGRQQPGARRARRGRELRSRHPGRHRVRAHPDEGRDAQQDRRSAAPARGGHLRLLLRVRRGDRRAAGCARCRSRSAARTARRRARWRAARAACSQRRGAAVALPRHVRAKSHGVPIRRRLRRWRSVRRLAGSTGARLRDREPRHPRRSDGCPTCHQEDRS